MKKIKHEIVAFSIERAQNWDELFGMIKSKVGHNSLDNFVELTIRPHNYEIKVVQE